MSSDNEKSLESVLREVAMKNNVIESYDDLLQHNQTVQNNLDSLKAEIEELKNSFQRHNALKQDQNQTQGEKEQNVKTQAQIMMLTRNDEENRMRIEMLKEQLLQITKGMEKLSSEMADGFNNIENKITEMEK